MADSSDWEESGGKMKQYKCKLEKGGYDDIERLLNIEVTDGWELHSLHEWGDNMLVVFVRDLG